MSIEEIAATLYRCTCELADCPGKGQSWEALKKPVRCKWCKRVTWNGAVDRRRRPHPLRQQTVEELRAYNRKAKARSRKQKKGAAVNAPIPAPLIADQNNDAAAPSPPPQGLRPAHAPGCSCTLCRLSTPQAKNRLRGPRLQQERKTGGKTKRGGS